MLKDNLPEDIQLNYNLPEGGLPPTQGQSYDESDRWGLAWAIEANDQELIRPKGAVYWSGIANSYFTLDVNNNIAIVYFTQFLPYNDKETFDFYKLFEANVYKSILK